LSDPWAVYLAGAARGVLDVARDLAGDGALLSTAAAIPVVTSLIWAIVVPMLRIAPTGDAATGKCRRFPELPASDQYLATCGAPQLKR
jgi:hypothetical protein